MNSSRPYIILPSPHIPLIVEWFVVHAHDDRLVMLGKKPGTILHLGQRIVSMVLSGGGLIDHFRGGASSFVIMSLDTAV